jgi:hypothetical protein
MSHFKIIVCCDDPDQVEALLAPFDENLEVEPYRNYQGGEPGDYWSVGILREDGRLPEEPTWTEVAEAHNAQYAPDGPGGDDGSEYLHTDGERAWVMSTYSPASKWDWYEVGGRYNGHFAYKPEFASEVIHGGRSWASSEVEPLHCDGGPKKALDLEKMRDEAEERARAHVAEFYGLVGHLPVATPWSKYVERARDEDDPYGIEDARRDYHDQPRVKALRASKSDLAWWDDAVGTFQRPVEDQVREARAKAIAGWGMVTREGEWWEQGRMGWWAANDANDASTLSYVQRAEAYIDSLPEDAYLISVDCHI